LAKTDLGDKQVCPNCGAKFYDLRKRPAVCPKCTTSFDPAEEGVRARRSRARVSANDPSYEDDEELEAAKGKKAKGEDDDEDEEVEETPEVDVEAAEPLIVDDDEEEGPAAGEEIPEGFSESDGEDLPEDAADDDTVPLIDDGEEFTEDELGEIGGGDDDDDSGR